jgi:hypothetical protein
VLGAGVNFSFMLGSSEARRFESQTAHHITVDHFFGVNDMLCGCHGRSAGHLRRHQFGRRRGRSRWYSEADARWKRAQEHGVEQADLEAELKKGMLRNARGDTVRQALKYFADGQPEMALRLFRLQDTKFAEPDAAHEAIRCDLQEYFDENWSDLTEEDWNSPDW